MDATTQGKIEMAVRLLQEVLSGKTDELTFHNTPFGAFFRDRQGKTLPAIKVGSEWVIAPPEPPAPTVEPQPEVVWPVVDYSNPRYTIGTCKTCVSYYADLYKFGFPGFVAEIKKFWDKKDTFYPQIKDFMKDYPELFPACVDC
jgi:hypothetical protein